MEKGHTVKNCKTRKFDVPNGLFKWMPKIAKERVNLGGPN